MENKSINILSLHGRKEVEDFFREELNGDESRLNERVNQLLQFPNGTLFCLPSEYRIDGVWVLVNRKAPYIKIYHT